MNLSSLMWATIEVGVLALITFGLSRSIMTFNPFSAVTTPLFVLIIAALALAFLGGTVTTGRFREALSDLVTVIFGIAAGFGLGAIGVLHLVLQVPNIFIDYLDVLVGPTFVSVAFVAVGCASRIVRRTERSRERVPAHA